MLSSEKHNIHWREQRGRLRFQETVEYSYGLGHPKGAPHKTTEDCSSKTNEMIALTTTVTGDGKEQKQGFLDSIELDYNRIAFINPWSRALFTVSDKPLLSVAKLLSERQQVQRISLAENGQMYEVEAVTPENNKVLLWFDVSRNFLTKKIIFFNSPNSEDRENRNEHEVISFVEAAPSLYYPQQIRSRFYTKGDNGKPFIHYEVHTQLAVQRGFPD